MTEEEKEALKLEEAEKQRLANEDIKEQAILDLKAKLDASIDPAEHAKLKAEHKKLMDEFINRRPEPKLKVKVIRPVIEIAQELEAINDGDMTNRAYIEKSLEYREAYIHELGTDPWTDFSVSGSGEPTEKTNKIANAYQQLLDENPSPVDFRIKFLSILKDDPNIISGLRSKKNKK